MKLVTWQETEATLWFNLKDTFSDNLFNLNPGLFHSASAHSPEIADVFGNSRVGIGHVDLLFEVAYPGVEIRLLF